MAKKTGDPTRSIPLRLNDEQRGKVRQAAIKLNISDQDVLRLAAGIGLEAFRRVHWDTAAVFCDAAFDVRRSPVIYPIDPLEAVAEEPLGNPEKPKRKKKP